MDEYSNSMRGARHNNNRLELSLLPKGYFIVIRVGERRLGVYIPHRKAS